MDVGAPTSLAEEENKFTGNGGRRTNSGGGALALRRLAARQERERGKLIGLRVGRCYCARREAPQTGAGWMKELGARPLATELSLGCWWYAPRGDPVGGGLGSSRPGCTRVRWEIGKDFHGARQWREVGSSGCTGLLAAMRGPWGTPWTAGLPSAPSVGEGALATATMERTRQRVLRSIGEGDGQEGKGVSTSLRGY